MNKEAPYRDQAERLRKKIERVPGPADEQKGELPPRSRLHANKKQKNRWRLKYPVIRLLVMFFIFMPISVFGVYQYLNGFGGEAGGSVVKISGYEKINVESNFSQNKTRAEIEEKDMEASKAAEAAAPVRPAPLSSDSGSAGAEGKETSGSAEHDNPKSNVTAEEVQEIEISTPQPKPDHILDEPEPTADEPNQDPEASEQPSDNSEFVFHTVAEGENLFRISLEYYQSQRGMEIIREVNNLKGDEIQLGQVLKIPLTD
jgi:LysM repeat protein